MFAYLSKKIAIPNNSAVKCVNWHWHQVGFSFCDLRNTRMYMRFICIS